MIFSIVIPVYNVEHYIEKCLRSVLNQPFGEFEIILVDDGSTDNSGEICDKFVKIDKRISVIHKPNGGLSSARNVGIQNARGEYIVFLDSDDYLASDAFLHLSSFVSSNIDVLVVNGNVIGKVNGVIDLTHISNDHLMNGAEFVKQSLLKRKMPMAVWLYIYRRSFLIDNNLSFTEGILHEDEDFTPRALLVAKNVCVTGVTTYNYVIRENSITTQKDKSKNADDILKTIDKLRNIYSQIIDRKLRCLLYDYLVSLYFNIIVVAKLIGKRKIGRKYKRFVLTCSFSIKNRIRSVIFCVSPMMYLWVHDKMRRG